MATVVLAAAACTSPRAPVLVRSATAASTGPAKAVIPPDTSAGAQLRWLIEALTSAVEPAHVSVWIAAGTTARDGVNR